MFQNLINKLHIKKVAKVIAQSKNIFIFTGAGISASAGIPTFRGENGLWNRQELEFFSSPLSWQLYTYKCWTAYEKFRELTNSARPTQSHLAIKELQDITNVTVATSNVDSLHYRAGTPAYEVHGALDQIACMGCGHVIDMPTQALQSYPNCKKCASYMRHNVVLWEEPIRYTVEVKSAIQEADCIILIGMSGIVTDIGQIAKKAKEYQQYCVEINPDRCTRATKYVDVHFRAESDKILPEIVDEVIKIKKTGSSSK